MHPILELPRMCSNRGGDFILQASSCDCLARLVTNAATIPSTSGLHSRPNMPSEGRYDLTCMRDLELPAKE